MGINTFVRLSFKQQEHALGDNPCILSAVDIDKINIILSKSMPGFVNSSEMKKKMS